MLYVLALRDPAIVFIAVVTMTNSGGEEKGRIYFGSQFRLKSTVGWLQCFSACGEAVYDRSEWESRAVHTLAARRQRA